MKLRKCIDCKWYDGQHCHSKQEIRPQTAMEEPAHKLCVWQKRKPFQKIIKAKPKKAK